MARKHVNKGKAVDKRDLPEKVCPVCNRPFSWRRKWERDWDRVVYCSKACSATKRKS